MSDDDKQTWLKVVLGGVSTIITGLLIAGIVSTIEMYSRMAVLESQMVAAERRMERQTGEVRRDMRERAAVVDRRSEGHNQRISEVEQNIPAIHADLRALRSSMERIEKRLGTR